MSPLMIQNDIAISPAQYVNTADDSAKGCQFPPERDDTRKATKPSALALKSMGANDQFLAMRIGLS